MVSSRPSPHTPCSRRLQIELETFQKAIEEINKAYDGAEDYGAKVYCMVGPPPAPAPNASQTDCL